MRPVGITVAIGVALAHLWDMRGLTWLIFVAACAAIGAGFARRRHRDHVKASILGAMVLGAQDVHAIGKLSGRGWPAVAEALDRLVKAGDVAVMDDHDTFPAKRLYFLTTKNARPGRPQGWEWRP